MQCADGVEISGTVLRPEWGDLTILARTRRPEVGKRDGVVDKAWGVDGMDVSVPISSIGTGPDLNSATDNGLERAARLLGMSVPEVKNRATITGSIEIGRHPGVVQVTFRAPLAKLQDLGLGQFVRDQYGIG